MLPLPPASTSPLTPAAAAAGFRAHMALGRGAAVAAAACCDVTAAAAAAAGQGLPCRPWSQLAAGDMVLVPQRSPLSSPTGAGLLDGHGICRRRAGSRLPPLPPRLPRQVLGFWTAIACASGVQAVVFATYVFCALDWHAEVGRAQALASAHHVERRISSLLVQAGDDRWVRARSGLPLGSAGVGGWRHGAKQAGGLGLACPPPGVHWPQPASEPDCCLQAAPAGGGVWQRRRHGGRGGRGGLGGVPPHCAVAQAEWERGGATAARGRRRRRAGAQAGRRVVRSRGGCACAHPARRAEPSAFHAKPGCWVAPQAHCSAHAPDSIHTARSRNVGRPVAAQHRPGACGRPQGPSPLRTAAAPALQTSVVGVRCIVACLRPPRGPTQIAVFARAPHAGMHAMDEPPPPPGFFHKTGRPQRDQGADLALDTQVQLDLSAGDVPTGFGGAGARSMM